MIGNFKAISISHKTAPLKIRERFTLNEQSAKMLMTSLREIIYAEEMIVLSTCNRTEVYYTSDKNCTSEILILLCLQKGIASIEEFLPYFIQIDNHDEAVNHLYNVSIGLESQVVGDIQIINQVKHAYQWSADLNLAGPFLHRLLHTIFYTNKKVVQGTPFRDGAASVSYATVELAEQLVAEKQNVKAFVIGLGEMGADVCRNLTNSSIKDITITNRTIQRAEELAKECNVKVIPFKDSWKAIAEADLIICSISKEEPFITYEKVKKLSILSHKFFIDISVPRSVESNVEEIPGVLVYHIDNIQNKATEALERRIQSIPLVKEFIAASIVEFNDWSKEMIVSPTINKLKNALEQIRQEELNRYLKQMDGEEAKKVDTITKNIMQKIMKLPVLQLKAACKRGEAETLIDILNDLFDLEKQSSEVKE